MDEIKLHTYFIRKETDNAFKLTCECGATVEVVMEGFSFTGDKRGWIDAYIKQLVNEHLNFALNTSRIQWNNQSEDN